MAIPRITSTTQAATLDYYGPVESSLPTEASKFLASFTDAAEEEVLRTLEAFMLATQDDSISGAAEKTACWFTIRVTKPTDQFAVPRWHQDGRMFPYDQGREDEVRSKYALTLLGPTTLMLQPTPLVFSIHQTGEAQRIAELKTCGPDPTDEELDDADDTLRTWLADALKDAPRVQVGDGDVVRFSWGRDDSPVHSEPDLISDRVFVTVLYGSETELRGMCDWRREEYGKFTKSTW